MAKVRVQDATKELSASVGQLYDSVSKAHKRALEMLNSLKKLEETAKQKEQERKAQEEKERDEEQRPEQTDFVIVERGLDVGPDRIEQIRADGHDAGYEGNLDLRGERFADGGVDDLDAALVDGRGDEIHQRLAEEVECRDKATDFQMFFHVS